MRFVSTRGGSAASFSEAVFIGLAPDGGLFVPRRLPEIDTHACGTRMFAHTAQAVLSPFLQKDALLPYLPDIVAQSFDFSAPLKALPGENDHVLELFHGPTAAFKDFGARFLAHAMAAHGQHVAPEARTTTILVATSGDTGSAVAAAFHDKPSVRVAILFPKGRVSQRQAHQLGCFGGNIAAYQVAGSFDDCQSLVKQAFMDQALRVACRLGSANSISLGRLLPQMAYYAHVAARYYLDHGQAMNFIVPTGNLGNAFAAFLAKESGLPIGEIVLATNANAVLPDFLQSGRFVPRPSVATLANAMDVGNPSNVERLAWLYPSAEDRRAKMRAHSVNDATIRARIQEGFSKYGRVWCPHTACAVDALEGLRAAGDRRPWCVVATAHPAKFAETVEPLLGREVEIPPSLAAMLARPAVFSDLPNKYEMLRAELLAHQ